MSTNIPKARKLLEQSTLTLKEDTLFSAGDAIKLINEALSLMTRKVNKIPSKTKRRKVTDAIIYGVLWFNNKYPDLSCNEIGDAFDVDGGRVSEIINKKRTPKKPHMAGDGMNEEIREAMLRRQQR